MAPTPAPFPLHPCKATGVTHCHSILLCNAHSTLRFPDTSPTPHPLSACHSPQRDVKVTPLGPRNASHQTISVKKIYFPTDLLCLETSDSSRTWLSPFPLEHSPQITQPGLESQCCHTLTWTHCCVSLSPCVSICKAGLMSAQQDCCQGQIGTK